MDKIPFFKLETLPDGSRLKAYSEKMKKIRINNQEERQQFISAVFRDCLSFLSHKLKLLFPPNVNMKIVYQTKKYRQIEREEEKRSLTAEVPKTRSFAFAVGNRIYVDGESLISLLLHGYSYSTFVFNLSTELIQEILHCYLPTKTEQEIYDMQLPLIEEFIGIELPEEIKNLKASDYYEGKT